MFSRKSDSGLPEIRVKAPSVDRGAHYYYNHHSAGGGGSGSLSKHWSYEQVDRYWPRPLTMPIAPPTIL